MTATRVSGESMKAKRGSNEGLIVRDLERGGGSGGDIGPLPRGGECLPLERGRGRAVRINEVRERSGESLTF